MSTMKVLLEMGYVLYASMGTADFYNEHGLHVGRSLSGFTLLFWSSGIMDCMMFTFEYRVQLMHLGASVLGHHALPLMNSFNKTKAANFFMQAMHPEDLAQ